MGEKSVIMNQKKKASWGKRLAMLLLAVIIASGQWVISPAPVQAVAGSQESPGDTYFTDTDNWGGGTASSASDGDMDVSIKNQNKATADNYAKYPVEFKIKNVTKLPTKSAQFLIRSYDVDEYNEPITSPANGEWDRVFFSSNPSDIALGAAYTPWSTDKATWADKIKASGIGESGQGYKDEINQGAYLGALSGKNEVWNTSVMTFKPEDFNRIALGDNYVGVTIHHYYQDKRSAGANTNWSMKVDWGQLVIDGGARITGEITEAGIKVENGKVTIDTSFIPKTTDNNFSMEVNVIEKTLVNGEVVERNIGLDKKLFTNPEEGTETDWKNIVITDKGIDPQKEYVVNIILFDDRGEGIESEKYTNPGFAEHIVTISTTDPKVEDISKLGLPSAPTAFTADDFKSKYLKVNGNLPNGEALQSVQIVTLPNVAQGKLELNGVPVTAGQKINVADLNNLFFVPVAGGLDGTVEFLWNGYNGTVFAQDAAKVTINTAPKIQDIHVYMKAGDLNFSFTGTDHFIPDYVDSDRDALVKIKIAALPDPAKGKLVLATGAGTATNVTVGQEITVADLGKLKFTPVPGVTGNVTFTWNGSDGLQYSSVDKTVTITVNTPPVVGDITRIGVGEMLIAFTSNTFAVAPAYADMDTDSLTQVKITLPEDFAVSGKLGYTAESEKVYIAPGDTVILTTSELNSLQFEPISGLPGGSIVAFPWYGSDGMHFSDTPANVIMTYKLPPIAEPLVFNEEEGVSSIAITLGDTVTGTTYNSISTNPLRGELVQDSTDPSGLSWTYIPNVDFQWGTDSFMYTVKDADDLVSSPVAITIHIHKALDGWVGNKAQGDATVVPAIPGEPLRLSAISSQSATGVTATVTGLDVSLTLANAATWETDGYKKWENTTFILPSSTATGSYVASYIALNSAEGVLQTELASKLTDNHFKVVESSLTVTANPEKIIGDGRSTTDLTAVLLDEHGAPIEGVEVVFSVPSATGQFIGTGPSPERVLTDAQGKATVTYQSAQITGTTEQSIILFATVHDVNLGLHAQDDVTVTFMPAAIKGFITTGDTNTPVANASVRVTLDLDEDGVITPGTDFDETVITGIDGSYSIIVPKGDVAYQLEITQPVMIGGVSTPVTYKQTAKVGEVTGSGDENFDSEKTVTGIVLFQQPNGQSALFNNDILAKASIYLKNEDGTYVSSNGVPTAFTLQNPGVFHADGLAVGNYELEVRYEIEPGKSIVMSRSSVSVTASGEMNITEALVDPYGTVTDAITKQTIEGSTVVLHYANTARNTGKGITPGATVSLPGITGFAPNDNASPIQLTDANGFYAYMVYPETDYYLVVTKTGYNTYTSPTISVEWDIVRHDLELSPFQSGTGTSQPDPETKLVLNLSLDKNKVKEGDNSEVTVTYKNESAQSISSGDIKVTLPEGAEVVDAAGGIVTGNTIVWKVTNLSAGKSDSYKLIVKWPLIDAVEKSYDISGVFTANSKSVTSSVKVNVFSDRFGELKHYRYILGYPDKEFKPNKSMTRAEVAAIVARLTENVEVNYELPYTDITPGHWATNYIKIATKHGYFNGGSDGLFRPEESITRGELAAVMARFLKLNVSKPANAHFTDTTGHWAGNTIESLYNGKFLTGYTNGSFKPDNDIIRVEAVTMINRMLYRGPLAGHAPLFPDMPESHWGFGEVQEATISHEAVRKVDGSETWGKTLIDDMQ